jgi:hypothetical protein
MDELPEESVAYDPLEAAGIPRDPVIEAYKKDVDRTLLRENLKLTPEQRIRNLERLQELAIELRRGMKEAMAARAQGGG